ncbi:MAG: YiiD C-terminal domain-containing protein [Pseudomonadota bacterium]
MNLTEIPFIKEIGIQKLADGNLGLPFSEKVHNHLQTIHASAQFALAETASGEMLQRLFPDLVGKVIPVLRESQIKFRKPATKSIVAYPTVPDESVAKFNEQFSKKGRVSISITVEVRDAENTTTSTGIFKWFIQSIETEKT